MNAKIIGEKISILRKSQNKTQQQLADEIFVTNKAVSKWESSAGLPDFEILPALASALGVSIDELISDDDISVKNIHTRTYETGYLKRILIRFAVISAAALMLAFGIYNIIWFHYINSAYTPFIDSGQWAVEAIRVQGAIDYSATENRTWIVYLYRSDDDRFEIQVNRPSYLRFGGQVNIVNISNASSPELGEIFGHFEVSFSGKIGRIQQVFSLNLHEWSTVFSPPLNAHVDRYGQPLGRSPDNSEEFYEKWLSLYERYYDEAMEMIAYFTAFFGEDVFR